MGTLKRISKAISRFFYKEDYMRPISAGGTVLVVPNYHMYSGERNGQGVLQKPNEVQFYEDLCFHFGKVVLAAAWKDLLIEKGYKLLDNRRAQFVSLGHWPEGMGRVRKAIFYARSTKRLLAIVGRFDITYIYLPGTNSLIAGIIASIRKKRFAVYLRGGVKHAGPAFEVLYKFIMKRAEFVICTGLALEKYAARYAETTSQVAPMTPFGPEDTRPARDITLADELQLLYVGTIAPAKGIFDLLAVAEKLKGVRESVAIKIVGNATPEMQEDLIHKISVGELEGYIEIVEFVSEVSTLLTIYSESHIFLFPSTFNEGFPRVLYEAMLAGCLVVAYSLPVYEEFLIDNRNCLLAAPGDVEKLVSLIKTVLADPGRFSRIAECGRNDVIAHLNSIGRKRHGQQVAELFRG